MKKDIETAELENIADEIESQIEMLDLIDPDCADLEIDIYTSRIRQLIDELREMALVVESEPEQSILNGGKTK